ncbi:hypothetical protein A5N78_04740 [Prescottella equi]|uniref:hypothetical protein n=1 Tax=Rhodococcus hoagii TaxID=43767 RepID=UPI000A0F8003|nr:hypothetical protein [Prescottella equi]ORL93446.1 hypothetical protein A5N78_04740 [Prescottella equi]ORM17799.1 hypothetical protein A5N70_11315 [Prescottella equi]
MTNEIAALDLETELAEGRSHLSLLERVRLRREIDQQSGVTYKPVSAAQMRRIARIAEFELPRIIRSSQK